MPVASATSQLPLFEAPAASPASPASAVSAAVAAPRSSPSAPSAPRSRRGGARRGAGRKPRDPKARGRVQHRARPRHHTGNPVHITLRARAGLPSFRHERIHRLLCAILSRQQPQHRPRPKAYAELFQVVHFSIQTNHIHLIVEAKAGALRSGVAGLVIAFAKRLNAEILGAKNGKGKVWGDRYHAVELDSPRQVRNALVYVLQNYRKHGYAAFGPVGDEHSTALRFDGWSEPVYAPYVEPLPEQPPWRPVKPRTWLLGTGWRTYHPPIRPSEMPRRTGLSDRNRGDGRGLVSSRP